VAFDDKQENITAIQSSMGEQVPLENHVKVTDEVEVWLRHLNDESKSTLKTLVARCVHGTAASGKGGEGLLDSVEAYPSQVLCLAEQIRFNSRCEHAIKQGKLSSLAKLLKKMLQGHINLLGDSTDMPLVQLKVKALVLDLVHMIDVVDQLVQAKVEDVGAWMWQKQLRYSLDSSNACVVCMCDAQIEYTYEYWGNAGKLVHTPLTDKCYLTLTQGMHMGFGGSPYGPAGTGKTESVKALGAALGRQVLVFNCDEGIDFQVRLFLYVCVR
jgi:dynein heavy chain 2